MSTKSARRPWHSSMMAPTNSLGTRMLAAT